MTTENDDRQVRDLLKRAAPPLPPEVREQAMAAVARARPRRHRRLVTAIAVILLLALLAAAVYATVRYLLIEGTLQFGSATITGHGPKILQRTDRYSGDLGWSTAPPLGLQPDMSPAGDEVVYVVLAEDWRPGRPVSIWREEADGSDPVDLTKRAGLSGANCQPMWSVDGRMIAFNHCDPVEGEPPCETGFHIWVMAADGSGARKVTRDGSPPTRVTDWSPDGSRLLCDMGELEQARTVTMDLWGQAIEVIPNIGSHAVWSPDGTMIASGLWEEKEVDGRPGVRRGLRLSKADGTDPRVFVEQFIFNSDAEAHVAQHQDYFEEVNPDGDWRTDVQTHVGPIGSVWSPGSDKIAFAAAMPFDPGGLRYRLQVEVWIYDLATQERTRVTYDEAYPYYIIWR
jgi:hypothetical protein